MFIPALIALVPIFGVGSIRVPIPFPESFDPAQFQREMAELRPVGYPMKSEKNTQDLGESSNGNWDKKGSEKNLHGSKKYWQEDAKKGDANSEKHNKDYNEEHGKSDKNHEEHYHHKEHGMISDDKKGESFQFGKKAAKKKQIQGFHNTQGKNEKKEVDSFYSNGHEEAETIHFGKHSEKHQKDKFVKKGEKWYKMAKNAGENGNQGLTRKEMETKEDKQFEKRGGSEKKYMRGQTFKAEEPKELQCAKFLSCT